MKHKIFLLIYIILILVLTSFHNVEFLFVFLLFLLILSGKNVFNLAKKSFFSILAFNSIISISYIILSFIQNKEWVDYIVLLNLRVFDLTFLTFLFASKVNLFKALDFSKTFSMILVLSYSQILLFKKTFEDFKLALKSRIITKTTPKKDIYNFVSTITFYFLNKSINNSKEISQAMKSRGFLD